MNKASIYQFIVNLIQKKIAISKNLMNDAQESANNDTKSSSGDKHETSRAMAILEKEKAANQYNVNKKLLQLLERINPNLRSKKITLGSIVKSEDKLFFISIGLGKIKIDNQDLFCISPVSPIGKNLMNKKVGDCFKINEKSYKIKEVL